MGKLMDYVREATGFDSAGVPASTTQFTFGFEPFTMSDEENIGDLVQITAVCEADAIVDVEIIDGIVKIEFDFSNDPQTMDEFVEELKMFTEQTKHVTTSLNQLMAQLQLAQRNNDDESVNDIVTQLRAINTPFLLPTIIPLSYGGEVKICFVENPKYTFFVADDINQRPYKVAFIYAADAIFCEDEGTLYFENEIDDIEAQQQELWYMQEAKKLEEETYRQMYGHDNEMYDDTQTADRRLKGVRIK